MITQNILSRSLRQTTALFLTVLLGFALTGCKKDAPTSIYEQYNAQITSGGPPTVTSISPTYGHGGVTAMTLTGANFSSTATANFVVFNSFPATVLQATPTQLVVRTPVMSSGDSVKVLVGVHGSELFSAAKYVKLDPATVAMTGFKTGEDVASITMDPSGNVYGSLLSGGGIGLGVKRITPAGVMSDYAPIFSSTVNRWTGMKMARGDTIFAVAHRSQIFRVLPGAVPGTWTNVIGATFDDLDFDANGNIWAAGIGASGEGTSVYRIGTNKTSKPFPVNGNFRAVRVFSGYVYLGGTRGGQEGVWRMPILAGDSLGAPEQVLSMAAAYPAGGYGVFALTFAADGDMYVGTDAPDGILIVHPNGASEPFFTGVLKPKVASFAWGAGATYMYVALSGTATPRAILRVHVEKLGAPYYR